MCCGMFSIIPGLDPLDVNSNPPLLLPSFPAPVVKTKNVFRHCHIPQYRADSPLVDSHCPIALPTKYFWPAGSPVEHDISRTNMGSMQFLHWKSLLNHLTEPLRALGRSEIIHSEMACSNSVRSHMTSMQQRDSAQGVKQGPGVAVFVMACLSKYFSVCAKTIFL